MDNRENIKSVLDELQIIYRMDQTELNEQPIDTYLISLVVDNVMVRGGILDRREKDSSYIDILFFFNSDASERYKDITELLKKVNELNVMCKYGNFYMDEDKDIVYSLVIPIIEGDSVNKEVFKYYFNSTLSVVKDAVSDMNYE